MKHPILKGLCLWFIVAAILVSIGVIVWSNKGLSVPTWYTQLTSFGSIIFSIVVTMVHARQSAAGDKAETKSITVSCNEGREKQIQPINMSTETNLDELFPQAVDAVLDAKMPSVSMLQRRLNLGYSRAARIVDQMEELGIVGPFQGSSPRMILITSDTWAIHRTEILEVITRQKEKEREEAEFRIAELKAKVLGATADSLVVDEEEWRRQQYGMTPTEYELKKVDAMEGHQFEYWCADILRRNGFFDVEVTPGSGDQGVDVIAEKDGIRFAIQCKCYSHDLGNSPVQEVHTGRIIYRCQIGVVMTNRYFTSGAKQAAEATGVLLWDRDHLIKLIESAQ